MQKIRKTRPNFIGGPKPRLESERFWEKVHKTDTCWLWTAGLNNKGYGRFRIGSNIDQSSGEILAHVWSYTNERGPVPIGLELDHLCKTRNCVRPDHLEPVTHQINVLRGNSTAAVNARKTHCPQGHPLSGNNLHIRPSGNRRCKTCCKEQNDARFPHIKRNKEEAA